MSEMHYYVTANTAEGLVNHLDGNLHNINKIVSLQHPSARLKTAIINNISKQYEDNQLEVLDSALGSEYLDGIIVRDKSLAFLDDKIATAKTDTINLTASFPVREQDLSAFSSLMHKAYDNFAEGLRIHDELEDIYIKQMDFDYADKFAEQFIQKLLTNVSKKERTPRTYTRLFGTTTADGVVNVVPQLIEPISNVYYIKGRAGTGKSVFMKEIARACEDYGFDVELYYCSFDPNSIDMVIVRDLDFCIFDSTDPHEFHPEKENDVIVDLYEELVAPGTDERFASEIKDIHTRYKQYMKEGTRCLKEAGKERSRIENKYMENITANQIRDAAQRIRKNVE